MSCCMLHQTIFQINLLCMTRILSRSRGRHSSCNGKIQHKPWIVRWLGRSSPFHGHCIPQEWCLSLRIQFELLVDLSLNLLLSWFEPLLTISLELLLLLILLKNISFYLAFILSFTSLWLLDLPSSDLFSSSWSRDSVAWTGSFPFWISTTF